MIAAAYDEADRRDPQRLDLTDMDKAVTSSTAASTHT